MAEITLPVFEGPLDLLLHRIERDDLDITAVSLVAVTDQYLAFARRGGSVNPHALAEFIAIGAKLIYLKSKALLPRAPEDLAPALEDDDVGRELVDLLREYKRFSEVTDLLQRRQEEGVRVFSRTAAPFVLEEGAGLDSVTVNTLYSIMMKVLTRVPAEPRAALIPRDSITLGMRMTDFRERLRLRGGFSFRRAIMECRTRLEVVLSFMAILELLKSGECDARQDVAWGDIEVVALAPVMSPES